jgi:hypothetical protein
MSTRIAYTALPVALFGLAGAMAATEALSQVTSGGTTALVEGTSTSTYINDKYQFSLGTFIVGTNLKSTFDGTAAGSGDKVDFAHTFDMNKDYNRFRLDGLWRITPKHHVRFVWFQNNITRTKTLDKDLAWGDYTFQAHADVSAESKLGVYELSYEYAFIRKPNLEVAAGAGVHMMNMSIKLKGDATFTDENGVVHPAAFSTSNSNLPAPFPVIGARATWAVTPNIFIEPEVQWFAFKYDAYNGNWWDARVAAKWMFMRHWGVGLGYDAFHVNVTVDKASFNGNVTLGYSGGQLMIVGSY